jgi:hypothetical protein
VKWKPWLGSCVLKAHKLGHLSVATEGQSNRKKIEQVSKILRNCFFFSVSVCAITAPGVPGGTLVYMNRFSTLCG